MALKVLKGIQKQMTKISLNSDNSNAIYNLSSSAKTKLQEAYNGARNAYQSCPPSSSYKNYLGTLMTKLETSKKNISRINNWFDLLKTRNDKSDEDSQSRLDKIEDITIKKHDLYVK